MLVCLESKNSKGALKSKSLRKQTSSKIKFPVQIQGRFLILNLRPTGPITLSPSEQPARPGQQTDATHSRDRRPTPFMAAPPYTPTCKFTSTSLASLICDYGNLSRWKGCHGSNHPLDKLEDIILAVSVGAVQIL